MSLVSAALVAKSGLSVAAGQIAIVARNVEGSGDVNAHRKILSTINRDLGGATLSLVGRAENAQLAAVTLQARSQASAGRTMADTLDRLTQASSDVDLQDGPSSFLAKLSNALQLWGSNPADRIAANAAIGAATDLAGKVTRFAEALNAARVDLDQELAVATSEVKDALSSLAKHNQVIVRDAGARDVTDSLDARDQDIGRIADLIDVRVVGRAGQDVMLTTSSGAMLFETTARPVQFSTTAALSAGQDGQSMRIDGVPLSSDSGGTRIGGRIGALLELRDHTLPAFQAHLDEFSRVLVEAFAEHDVSGGGGAPQPGLFTTEPSMGVPTAGAPVDGMALALRVNPRAVPSEGGVPNRVRDGGLTGPDDPHYIENTGGGDGYSGRLIALTEQLQASRAINPSIGFGGSLSADALSRAIDAAVHSARSGAHDQQDRSAAVQVRATAAFTGEVGVNLDNELSHMLELERSYQASSRLISTIDQMLAVLLEAVGGR